MTLFTRILRTGLPVLGVYAFASCATADESIDNALKGRDSTAIMQMLKSEGQSAAAEAAAVDPASVAQPAAQPSATAPALPQPVAAPESTIPEKDLTAFREQLANEIAGTRAGQPAPPAETVAPSAPERKRGLLTRLFSSDDEESTEAVKPATAGEAEVVAAERTAPPRPAMESDAMARNREALDALVRRSRDDVVRMAMGQVSGDVAAVPSDEDSDAWKKAGPSAWRYNGEWDNGTMQGQGRLAYGDGWEYTGSWKGGVMDGQGSLTYPDGTRYEGQWRNGRMHGLGKLTYPDGWSFIGQWRDGVISGQGTLIHPGR